MGPRRGAAAARSPGVAATGTWRGLSDERPDSGISDLSTFLPRRLNENARGIDARGREELLPRLDDSRLGRRLDRLRPHLEEDDKHQQCKHDARARAEP